MTANPGGLHRSLNILLAFLPQRQGSRDRAYDAKAADGSTAEINSHFDGRAGAATMANEVILPSCT
jgi:hypothetical protein